MTDVLSLDVDAKFRLTILTLKFGVDLQALIEHFFPTTSQQAVTRQCQRVAFDAAVAWREICHLTRRPHVAGLTLLALVTRGTFEPLGIRAVDMHAEYDSLMAAGKN